MNENLSMGYGGLISAFRLDVIALVSSVNQTIPSAVGTQEALKKS